MLSESPRCFNRHLTINAANHPLLIAEANHNTHGHREKLAQLAFETHQAV